MCAKKSPVQPKTKVVYEKTYKLKTVVQIKLKTKNFDPFKIMVLVVVIVFIFVFSKGIEVLTSPNPYSYSIPYDGSSKSVFEKWLPFSKDK